MFDKQGYALMEAMFFINNGLNIFLLIYLSVAVVMSDCNTQTPALAFWVVVELIYMYTELLIYFGFSCTAWTSGDLQTK